MRPGVDAEDAGPVEGGHRHPLGMGEAPEPGSVGASLGGVIHHRHQNISLSRLVQASLRVSLFAEAVVEAAHITGVDVELRAAAGGEEFVGFDPVVLVPAVDGAAGDLDKVVSVRELDEV